MAAVPAVNPPERHPHLVRSRKAPGLCFKEEAALFFTAQLYVFAAFHPQSDF